MIEIDENEVQHSCFEGDGSNATGHPARSDFEPRCLLVVEKHQRAIGTTALDCVKFKTWIIL